MLIYANFVAIFYCFVPIVSINNANVELNICAVISHSIVYIEKNESVDRLLLNTFYYGR